MRSSTLPTGPDAEAITRVILRHYPETVVAEATFRDVVLPLIAEAHDRLAAVHARHHRDEQPARG